MQHATTKRKQKTIHNPYNIGFIDRAFRFIIGGALIGSVYYLTPAAIVSIGGQEVALMKLLTIVGIYPALTAWIGWDPVYHLTGVCSSSKLDDDICGDIVDQVKAATHA